MIDDNKLREVFNLSIEPDKLEDEVIVQNHFVQSDSTKCTQIDKLEGETSSQIIKKPEDNVDSYINNLNNIKKTQEQIFKKAEALLDSSVDIAIVSQHPNSIAAASNVLSSMNNILESMAKIDLNILKLKFGSSNVKQSINVDKGVFIGSTAELQKLIKEKLDSGADK